MLKNRIFMYLFFFALLFVIFQYMNEKTIFEAQEKKITLLTEKKIKGLDSINTGVLDFRIRCGVRCAKAVSGSS